MNALGAYAGAYFDGRTAQARDVTVECASGTVRILQPDGAVLAIWPAGEVRLAVRHRTGNALRLRCGTTDEARVTIADAAALAALEQCCPNLHRSADRIREHWRPLLLWGGGAIAAIVFLVAVGVPWLAGVAAQAVPYEVEAAWGDEVVDQAAGIISRFMGGGAEPRFCETPAGRAVLDRLVADLSRGSDLAIPVTVRVLDAPTANAITLPGGQILLISGLVAEAESGSEVAGVLAHEIGHVVHRHSLEGAIKSVGLATLLSLVVGDVTGGTIIIAGAQVLLETSYSRAAEREADAVAVALLNSADVSAEPVAAFFDRLANQDPDEPGLVEMISTHPPSQARAAAIRAAATGQGVAMSDADWQTLQHMCDD